MRKVTTATLKEKKLAGESISMITAYDYPSAKLVDEAGVDCILVGDSLGMVVLGYTSTIPVTIADMVHHSKAVARGTKHALVVTDLPFLTYHGAFEQTLTAAAAIMQEGGADAVKLEGGAEHADTVSRLTNAGVPVMGHLGLTPQSVNQLGGYKVQGKDLASAQKLIADALALEKAGIFALVLECVPAPLAKSIAKQVSIPVIGIGAGVDCDGQVLVFHDILNYASDITPKFAKRYANVAEEIKQAIKQYIQEVKNKEFPAPEHSFSMQEEVIKQLYGGKAD